MKTLATLLLLFAFTSIFSQSKSTVFYTLDTIKLTNYKTSVYKWDAFGINTSKEDFMYESTTNSYYLAGKDTFEYNSTNQLVKHIYYSIGTNGLVPFRRNDFIKNSLGKDSIKEHYYWNESSSTWSLADITKLSYNQNGLLTSLTGFRLNNGIWDTAGIELFTYNSNSQLIIRESKGIDQSTNVWKPFSKFTYAYNSQGKLISEIYQEWEYMYPNHWDNLYKFTYTYDGNGNLVEDISYDGDYNTWALSYRILYTFNTTIQNNLIKWPQTEAIYEPFQSFMFFTQSTNQIIHGVTYMRTNQNTWLATGDSVFYKYSSFVDDIKLPVTSDNISLYPNPASDKLFISGIDDQKQCELIIYDITGKVISKNNISRNYFEVSDLQNGIYLVELISENKLVFRKKIVITKTL